MIDTRKRCFTHTPNQSVVVIVRFSVIAAVRALNIFIYY